MCKKGMHADIIEIVQLILFNLGIRIQYNKVFTYNVYVRPSNRMQDNSEDNPFHIITTQ